MLRRAADGRGDELSLAEIDDEARPDGHVQNALDQGAGGRQVADDDGIAVVVVDRADLAEQRETVVALARGARRLDRPRPRRGMVEQFGLRHGLAIDIALDMTDVEPPDQAELVERYDHPGGRSPPPPPAT